MNIVNKFLLSLGSNGNRIYKVTTDEDKTFVMKKILIPSNIKEENKILNEVKILKNINHDNIIKYYDSFINKRKLCIIMEYADSDLKSIIKSNLIYNTSIPENLIWKWFAQILSALYYIHKKKIIHRDIKSGNIFLIDNNIKLGDFGLSKMLDSFEFAQTGVGTPYYFSPEVCKGEKYNYMSDMWMLGCLLYELCSLKRPFESHSLSLLIEDIINREPEEINGYSSDLIRIIKMLMKKRPEERITIKDILKSEIYMKYLSPFLNIPVLNYPKLCINIEEENDITPRIINSETRSYKKLTPSYCKTDMDKIIRNMKISPFKSPRKIEIDSNISELDFGKQIDRKKSNNSVSTSNTIFENMKDQVPKRSLKDKMNKGHFRHISVDINSIESPNNRAIYEVEKIIKKNVKFPKFFLTPTYISKKNIQVKEKPNTTKVRTNKRYEMNENSYKQYILSNFGMNKYNQIMRCISQYESISDEKLIQILGNHDSLAIMYAKLLFDLKY